jgi:hypothetical protein
MNRAVLERSFSVKEMKVVPMSVVTRPLVPSQAKSKFFKRTQRQIIFDAVEHLTLKKGMLYVGVAEIHAHYPELEN